MIPNAASLPLDLLQDKASQQIPGLPEAMKKRPTQVGSVDQARQLYESAATPEELKLKDVATEFVSILQNMLFKQMDSGIERSGLLSGGAMEETFRPMLLDEYSKLGSAQQGNMLTFRVYEMMYNATIKTQKPGAEEEAAAEPEKEKAPQKGLDISG